MTQLPAHSSVTDDHAQSITSQDKIRPQFWQRYTLQEMTSSEWEAVCDGCGLCCLHKYISEDGQHIEYTDVACQLLDCQTGHCQDYANRFQVVTDCLSLTPSLIDKITWLPQTCGYLRLHQGRPLPEWHPLRSGDSRSVIAAGISAAGRCISETSISEEDAEMRVVQWVSI